MLRTLLCSLSFVAPLAAQVSVTVDPQVQLQRSLELSSRLNLDVSTITSRLATVNDYNFRLDAPPFNTSALATNASSFAMGDVSPRAAWQKDDPADSLYRAAREALNTGDYRRASTLFEDIPRRFPKSAYVLDAPYWQAFALYRIGGTTELTQALAVLDKWRTDNPAPAKSSNNTRSGSTLTYAGVNYSSGRLDVDGLSAQIAGVLLSRGQGDQPAVKRALAARGDACDKDDQSVKAEALSAIMQSNPEQGRALAAKILARRDDCSIPLRRNALLMSTTRNDPGVLATLIAAARNDPATAIRTDAISALGRQPSDEAMTVLDEFARGSDNKLQHAAIEALGSSSNPAARDRLRALLTRVDSVSMKLSVIDALGNRSASPADASALQALYASKDASLRVKEHVVSAVGRMGGDANEKWLMALVQRDDEPASVRSTILDRLGRMMDLATLTRFYDTANSRDLRGNIISQLGSRTESGAVDKLIDIVKNGTDPTTRGAAISVLARSKDPRAVKLLLDLVDR